MCECVCVCVCVFARVCVCVCVQASEISSATGRIYTYSFLNIRPIQAKIKTFITLFEKCKRIYGLKVIKGEFKKAGTLQLTGIRRIDGEL